MALTPEQIEQQLAELKALAETRPGQQVERQEQQGFTLNLGGNAYTVRDGVEAQRLVDQYESQKREEIERLRIEAEAQAQQVQQPVAPAASTTDSFDKNRFAELFLKDPREAQRYVWQNDPMVVGLFQNIANELAQVKQEAAANAFLAQHKDDYVASPANYKALESVIASNNLPWTLDAMNLAYVVAKQQGVLELPVSTGRGQSQEVDSEEEPVYAQRTPTPPRVKRRVNSEDDQAAAMLDQFSSLSADQMKAFLEKNYA